MTIVVIFILVAIAIPVIKNIRERGQDSQCKSNVRQLGSAALIYLAEHGQLPPGNLPMYTETLAPYLNPTAQTKYQLQQGSKVEECPARGVVLDGIVNRSYAANPLVLRNGPEATYPGAPLTPATINRPSEVIMFAECMQRPANHSTQWKASAGIILSRLSDGDPYRYKTIATADNLLPPSEDTDPSSSYNYFRFRHNGKLNAVMVDGSVVEFAKDTIKERNVIINY